MEVRQREKSVRTKRTKSLRLWPTIRQDSSTCPTPTSAEWLRESIGLFSSIGSARLGSPFIKSAHDLHELASQQDERAPQYEGDAIE
jgi:hypothetical protein